MVEHAPPPPALRLKEHRGDHCLYIAAEDPFLALLPEDSSVSYTGSVLLSVFGSAKIQEPKNLDPDPNSTSKNLCLIYQYLKLSTLSFFGQAPSKPDQRTYLDLISLLKID